jgi:hypothetical protein
MKALTDSDLTLTALNGKGVGLTPRDIPSPSLPLTLGKAHRGTPKRAEIREVGLVQLALTKNGLGDVVGPIDHQFGARLVIAIERFQRAATGIAKVDRMVGPVTWKRLLARNVNVSSFMKRSPTKDEIDTVNKEIRAAVAKTQSSGAMAVASPRLPVIATGSNIALPDSVKRLRIKPYADNQSRSKFKGKSSTIWVISERKIATFSELWDNGGQAFEGGPNNPKALYIVSKIAEHLGNNFDRVTAQNDIYHKGRSSNHVIGDRLDFTITGISYKTALTTIKTFLASMNLTANHTDHDGQWIGNRHLEDHYELFNEKDKPSFTGAPAHFHFGLHDTGKALVNIP